MRPLRDLALALGFLTLLPVGRRWPEGGAPDAVGFYPWVGWVLGAEAVLVAWALRLAAPSSGARQLLIGALVIASWALTTRLLHWDGLADSADALWGSHDRERRLEIMRDSRIGSFGTAAVVLVALLQAAGAASLLEHGALWALVLAPVLGRAAASFAAWTLPAARREGLGLTVVRRPSAYAAAAAAAAVLALLVLGHLTAPRVPFFLTSGIGCLAGIAVPRVLARPVEGMTGDLFGATILTVETIVLMAGALVT